MKRAFGAVSLLIVMSLACGGADDGSSSSSSGGDPGAVKSSCDHIQGYSECSDNFEGAYMAGEDFLKGLCGMVEGDFKTDAPCPRENLVGGCDDGLGTTNQYYSTGEMPFTAETAKADCAEDEGTWVPAN